MSAQSSKLMALGWAKGMLFRMTDFGPEDLESIILKRLESSEESYRQVTYIFCALNNQFSEKVSYWFLSFSKSFSVSIQTFL
jgi:hypothetical protein